MYLQHCISENVNVIFLVILLKIHPSAIYAMLLPFSVLNYDPAQADELYDVCIQHIIPHISKLIREHFPFVNPASH